MESWIWIILLISALVYFQWLVQTFHSENAKLRDVQNQFQSEAEEKYQRNRQLQTEIQAQLEEATRSLLKFLQAQKDPESYEIKK